MFQRDPPANLSLAIFQKAHLQPNAIYVHFAFLNMKIASSIDDVFVGLDAPSNVGLAG